MDPLIPALCKVMDEKDAEKQASGIKLKKVSKALAEEGIHMDKSALATKLGELSNSGGLEEFQLIDGKLLRTVAAKAHE